MKLPLACAGALLFGALASGAGAQPAVLPSDAGAQTISWKGAPSDATDDAAAAACAAANEVRSAVLEGRATDLYGLLPEPWKRDLDARLRQLAAKVDRPLFEQAAALAGELATLAEEKSDLVQAWFESERTPLGDEEIATAAGALRLVSEWKYDDFANARWDALLGDPRAEALLAAAIRFAARKDGVEEFLSEFSPAGPERDGVVPLRFLYYESRYDWDENGRGERRIVENEDVWDWTRVNGRWVPAPLVHSEWRGDTWRGIMGSLREEIGRISPRDLGEVSMALTMVRVCLPRLRQAETLRDVRAVFRDFD